MSSRIFTALLTLLLAAPDQAIAQNYREMPARALASSPAAAALLPDWASIGYPHSERLSEPLTAQAPNGRAGSSVLMRAIVLAGASLGGLWAGAQAPFSPADDDSDLSVWHLLTAPAASVAAVSVASMVLSDGPSLRGSLLGAAAGLGVGLVASMGAGDSTVLVSYAAVHGLVTALMTR